MNEFAFYLDLDGVCADYVGGFRNDHPEHELDPALNRSSHLLPGSMSERKLAAYKLIAGTDFYARLPLMPGAVDIYNAIAKYDPVILTGAPKFGSGPDLYFLNPHWLGAAFHKRNWVETVLLPTAWEASEPDVWEIVLAMRRERRIRIPDERFICTTSERKHEFMGRRPAKHQVIIDDRPDVIGSWEAAGGIGILHVDAETTVEKIENLTA